MRESKVLEFKESVSNTFLKTVSAFANYDGGEIIFGMDDDGNVVGIQNPEECCLNIENKINDSIVPQPSYALSIDGTLIRLRVESGIHKPYLYHSKAYRRNDTATIEADSLEVSRLILEGRNLQYESLPCTEQKLEFQILQDQLRDKIHLETFSRDTLRTLDLYNNDQGYNNAAGILADRNQFPGIDLAKFGNSINVIQKCAVYDHISLLSSYEKAVEEFATFYEYEEIKGSERLRVEKIPEAAFREAIANAIVQRTWDVASQIRVLMFEDHIEISSPGGLPAGISENEYLAGVVSVPRNPILANVFFRLGYIEILGTGIRRIQALYEGSVVQPRFEVTENSISVSLPVYEQDVNLDEDELQGYHALKHGGLMSMSEITAKVSFGRSKAIKIVQSMQKKGILTVRGNGRGTRYKLL